MLPQLNTVPGRADRIDQSVSLECQRCGKVGHTDKKGKCRNERMPCPTCSSQEHHYRRCPIRLAQENSSTEQSEESAVLPQTVHRASIAQVSLGPPTSASSSFHRAAVARVTLGPASASTVTHSALRAVHQSSGPPPTALVRDPAPNSTTCLMIRNNIDTRREQSHSQADFSYHDPSQESPKFVLPRVSANLADMRDQYDFNVHVKGFATSILDSGADHHMVSDSCHLENMVTSSTPTKLFTAIQEPTVFMSHGSMSILTFGNFILHLPQVLFHKLVPHNILSVRQLLVTGFQVFFTVSVDGLHCAVVVRRSDAALMLVAYADDTGQFVIDLYTMQ